MRNARGERIASWRVRWAAVVVVGAVVALAPSLTWSENRGQCALIEAPWPIVLPDGSIHEAGSLKLCLQQMWTPASGLHEIRVNERTIGLFASRVGTSEEPIEGVPVVVFERNGTDEHHLIGYAWPDDGAMRTYILRRSGETPRLIAKLPLLASENTEILMAVPPQ